MKKYALVIREVDRAIYNALKSGEKTVETRANSPKYATVNIGDFLVFKCSDDSFKKQIVVVKRFLNIDEMLSCYKVQDVNPALQTRDELISMYNSFPNYNEKIKRFGLIAFELSVS